MSRNDIADWVRKAKKAGWRVEEARRGGHLKWYPPGDGPFIVTSQHGSVQGRGLLNDRVRLRKAGLDI